MRTSSAQDNTKISYLYRDGSNYKYYTEIIVRGQISQEEAENLEEYLFEGDGFIPEQIGLPCKRPEKYTNDDHPFCELTPESFEPTSGKPTVDMTAQGFLDAIKKVNDEWDHFFVW